MKKPIILPSFLFLSCQFSFGQYVYQAPEKINDGFQVGTLQEVGIDSTLIHRPKIEVFRMFEKYVLPAVE